MQPLQNCIGPKVRISREILFLPYAGFSSSICSICILFKANSEFKEQNFLFFSVDNNFIWPLVCCYDVWWQCSAIFLCLGISKYIMTSSGFPEFISFAIKLGMDSCKCLHFYLKTKPIWNTNGSQRELSIIVGILKLHLAYIRPLHLSKVS